MRKYFLILSALSLGPITLFYLWRFTLPTEQHVVDRLRAKVEARTAYLKTLLAKLPPVGSVTANTLPPHLDPRPVCNLKTGECNLQITEVFELECLHRPPETQKGEPRNLAEVLLYTVREARNPAAKLQVKVWGFADWIEQGLEARYLLVQRFITRPKDNTTKTVGIEAFLVDMQEDRIVGSFTYPKHLYTISNIQERFSYLTDTLGGTVSPQFDIHSKVRDGDLEHVRKWVMLYTYGMVLISMILLSALVTTHGQQKRLAELKAANRYPELLTCPRCGRLTDRLKQAYLIVYVLFLIIAFSSQGEQVRACPRCMRRTIRKRLLWNLLPGNLAMIFIGPVMLSHYFRTFTQGHSLEVVEPTLKGSQDGKRE